VTTRAAARIDAGWLVAPPWWRQASSPARGPFNV
jgi:hypothetical protein